MQKNPKSPKIDCYLVGNCASEPLLRALMDEVKGHVPSVEISFHKITPEEAQKLGITGSPTVLVNGKDVSPQTTPSGGS